MNRNMTTISQLSPEAAGIYERIKQTYKVEFDTLKFNEVSLSLLKVADIEPLLAGRDPFRDVSAFPFWIKLWEASIVLAHLIGSMGPGNGRSFLEIGAGLGAPGLAAAAQGYRTTLSDYQELILDFERVSAAASGLPDIDFQLIDWLAPPELGRFEVMAGAEILFREDFFEPLLALFRKLLAPGGTIYLAHDVRRQSLPKFLLLAEKEYEIAVSTRTMTAGDEKLTIIVNRLQARKTG